jgi:hypothetical protein
MSDPGSGYGKVFGRFTEPAHRVLGPEKAERGGHRYLGPVTLSCWARWASTWIPSATTPTRASASGRLGRRPGG